MSASGAATSSTVGRPPPSGGPRAAAASVVRTAVARKDVVSTLLGRTAAYCHRHDVGQDSLALFGLVFGLAAGVVLLGGHLGLGAVLGAVGLFLLGLAAVPAPLAVDRGPLVDALGSLGELVVLAGFVAGIARLHAGVVAALALVVVATSAWLSLARPRAGASAVPAATGLWSRGDRTAVLLLGGLVGRPVPALVVLAVVVGLDAWSRLERLDAANGAAPSPSGRGFRRFLLPDARFAPAVRWASLAATALALFLLPVDARWRF
jgi:hypothetical protein